MTVNKSQPAFAHSDHFIGALGKEFTSCILIASRLSIIKHRDGTLLAT